MIYSIREKPNVNDRLSKSLHLPGLASANAGFCLSVPSRFTRQGYKPDLDGACSRAANNKPKWINVTTLTICLQELRIAHL
jgi:hypothetical protein